MPGPTPKRFFGSSRPSSLSRVRERSVHRKGVVQASQEAAAKRQAQIKEVL